MTRRKPYRRHLSKSTILLAIIGSLAVLNSGCSQSENKYVPPPPPEVTVSKPIERPVTEYLEFTGNTQAFEQVALTARVEGFLTGIHFKDGDIVKKGDLLFTIEPPPYEAKLRLAEANLAAAQARLLRASLEYNRQLQLIKQNATSQATVEQWQSERDASEAEVQQQKANLDIARINLSYTQVRAPFNGRIDRHLVDLGNLVGSGQATQLAIIYRIDPIYAYFNINERDLVRLMERERRDTGSGKKKTTQEEDTPVYLAIEGERDFPHEGKLDYAATALDQNTGTLLVRAILNNPLKDSVPVLLPGMFVRLKIPVREKKHALLVPERALGVDQGGRYLLVVNDQNIVEQRPVTAGTLIDQMRVIKEGLQGGEWVVVNGIQRARPGLKVTPVRQDLTATDAMVGTGDAATSHSGSKP